MERGFSVASISSRISSIPFLSIPFLLVASAIVAWMLWNRPATVLASTSQLPKSQAVQTGKSANGPSNPEVTGSTNPSNSQATPVTTDPNLLVLAAVRQAVWGPAISCRVQQTTKAFGQQSLLIGEMKSEPIASSPMRRLRYTARVAVGDTAFDLLQVSDGRMLWTRSTPNAPPKRIILDQVLQSIPSSLQYPDTRPEVHLLLAVGGQAELLRGLYHRYNWYKAVSGKINGNDVWQLVGRMRTEPTRIAGNAPIDNKNSDIGSPTQHLPTEARLTLSRSTKLPYFPYIVEYFQRSSHPSNVQNPFELMTRIEFKDPTTETRFLESDLDRISEMIEEIQDETADYLPTFRLTSELPPLLR